MTVDKKRGKKRKAKHVYQGRKAALLVAASVAKAIQCAAIFNLEFALMVCTPVCVCQAFIHTAGTTAAQGLGYLLLII